jgi:hypothetical protein
VELPGGFIRFPSSFSFGTHLLMPEIPNLVVLQELDKLRTEMKQAESNLHKDFTGHTDRINALEENLERATAERLKTLEDEFRKIDESVEELKMHRTRMVMVPLVGLFLAIGLAAAALVAGLSPKGLILLNTEATTTEESKDYYDTKVCDISISTNGLLVAGAVYTASFEDGKSTVEIGIYVHKQDDASETGPLSAGHAVSLSPLLKPAAGQYSLTVNASGFRFLEKGKYRIEFKGNTEAKPGVHADGAVWSPPIKHTLSTNYYVLSVSG